MSDNPETSGSGNVPAESTATPSGTEAGSQPGSIESIKAQLNEYRTKAEQFQKDADDFRKVKELYSAHPNGAELFKKYVYDQNFRTRMDAELSGGDVAASSSNAASDSAPNLDSLDEQTRAAVEAYVNKRVEESSKATSTELMQLKQQHYDAQIDKWRGQFSKANGFPVDFKDVETDIAEMLNSGKAVDAIAAYKQIAFEHAQKGKAEMDKTIKDLKLKASMSRASVPTTMNVKQKGERRTVQQAWTEALDELGVG